MVALLCTDAGFFIPQRILKTQHTMNYLICSQWQAAQLKNNRKDNLWANTFNFRKLHFFGYYTLYDYFFLNTYIVCTFEFMVCILYNYSLKHLFFCIILAVFIFHLNVQLIVCKKNNCLSSKLKKKKNCDKLKKKKRNLMRPEIYILMAIICIVI